MSGPFLDRIDIHVRMERVPPFDLLARQPAEDSATVRSRIAAAWGRAKARNGGRQNAVLSGSAAVRAAAMSRGATALLDELAGVSGMSARGVHRVVRVARTIADLADRRAVDESDVLAAATLRDPHAPWSRAA